MKRIVKKASERRQEIINAGRELFQTKEYEKVTMQELMERLNIEKWTMYHYFSSKEDLLEAVLEDLEDEELRKKEAVVITVIISSKGRNLNALDTMQILLTADTSSEDHEHILDMLHHPGNSKIHARQLGRYLTKLAPLYADVIEDGCTQGIFTTEHPLESAEFLLAGMQLITDAGIYPLNEEQPVERIKAFPTLVEGLLRAPKGSFSFLAE